MERKKGEVSKPKNYRREFPLPIVSPFCLCSISFFSAVYMMQLRVMAALLTDSLNHHQKKKNKWRWWRLMVFSLAPCMFSLPFFPVSPFVYVWIESTFVSDQRQDFESLVGPTLKSCISLSQKHVWLRVGLYGVKYCVHFKLTSNIPLVAEGCHRFWSLFFYCKDKLLDK